MVMQDKKLKTTKRREATIKVVVNGSTNKEKLKEAIVDFIKKGTTESA